MSKLIIVSYDNEYKAEEMRLKFLRMQKEYVVSICLLYTSDAADER